MVSSFIITSQISFLIAAIFNGYFESSKSPITYTVTQVHPDVESKQMYCKENEQKNHVGDMSIIKYKELDIWARALQSGVDISSLRPSEITMFKLISIITTNYDLKQVALFTDLYIKPEHRGKNYAQQLIKTTIKEQFSKHGIHYIAIIPNPFEYKENVPTNLYDEPDYEIKKQRLIKLYQSCGFMMHDSGIFMYTTKDLFFNNSLH